VGADYAVLGDGDDENDFRMWHMKRESRIP
jgi:hypothetical protein